MIYPCQYCRRPVENAECFLNRGVWPCCRECRWIPATLAALVLTVSLAGIIACSIALWRMR